MHFDACAPQHIWDEVARTCVRREAVEHSARWRCIEEGQRQGQHRRQQLLVHALQAGNKQGDGHEWEVRRAASGNAARATRTQIG